MIFGEGDVREGALIPRSKLVPVVPLFVSRKLKARVDYVPPSSPAPSPCWMALPAATPRARLGAMTPGRKRVWRMVTRRRKKTSDADGRPPPLGDVVHALYLKERDREARRRDAARDARLRKRGLISDGDKVTTVTFAEEGGGLTLDV